MSSISTALKTKKTEQYIENLSFDETYQQSAVEILGEDSANTALKRLQADSSGYLKVNVAVGGTSGSQYADGAARGTATGTLMMVDDGTNIQSVAGTTGGLLKIDLSGTTANTTAIKVDGSAVTQPVSGTFWQATQPVSIAATVGVDVSDEATRLLGVVYGSQGAQLQQKITSNDLIVTLDSESVAVTGTFWQATQPVSGTFWQATQPVSGTFWQATQPVSNAGTFAVQESGGALTALQLIDNAVSGAGFNITQFGGAAVPIGAGLEATAIRVTLPTDGTGVVKLGTGTNAIGKLAANDGIDIGDVTINNSAVDGTNNLFATQVKPVAVSTYAPTRFADLGASATLNVKGSAGNVLSLWCHNENTADRYIQLHNTATTPAGAATPLYTFLVTAGDQILIGTDFFTQAGAYFSTGIAFAFSTTKDTYTAGTAGDQSTIIHYI